MHGYKTTLLYQSGYTHLQKALHVCRYSLVPPPPGLYPAFNITCNMVELGDKTLEDCETDVSVQLTKYIHYDTHLLDVHQSVRPLMVSSPQ